MIRNIAGWREDAGSTIVAVLMTLLVVSALSVGTLQLAQHSNDVSSVDRERFQGVSAAEAGVTAAMDRLETGAVCDASATPFASLYDGSKLLGRYRTRIDPEAGSTCGQTPRRVIHSWGYPPTGGNRALRHLEVTVELVPQAGFPFTLFAEGSQGTILVKNSGAIAGDVYSEMLDQSKNNLSSDNIVTPGSIVTQNNAVYSGTLWAGGNISLGQNSSLGQSALATGTAPGSQGDIALGDNADVGGDVRAKGTVTLGSGAVVHGSTSQGDMNLPPPPVLTKPTFTWDPANYPSYTSGTAAQITSALNTYRNNLQGTFYADDTSTSTVVFPDNVTITGPFTLVTKGKVDMGRSMSVSGGPYQVVIVAQGTGSDAIDIVKSVTAASGLDVLLYTMGGVDMKNNVTMTGAMYADVIDMKNTFSIAEAQSLKTTIPAGFTWNFGSAASFSAVPKVWREIVPGTPPE
jgi:hypothetical protein